MSWAKIGQIQKIREETEIKGLNLEENPWMMSIIEYLGQFQWFWAVLEEKKKKEEF